MAYSYIGPELTYPIYYDGTIGQAKRHLTKTAGEINEKYEDVKAYISVNKALVTQASAAIPIVPLYFAILYKVMKEQGTHEGCIQQIARLFKDKLLAEHVPAYSRRTLYSSTTRPAIRPTRNPSPVSIVLKCSALRIVWVVSFFILRTSLSRICPAYNGEVTACRI